MQGEIKELNRLTSILLDIFEDQLDMGRLVIMEDAQTLLDQQLRQLGRSVLTTGGSIKAADARLKAEKQYEEFDALRKQERHDEADQNISALVRESKNLPKRPQK